MREKLEIKKDERGGFIEVFKFPNMGQVSYSTSLPGVTRGNHYHTRKREYFCVIEGDAKIRMRDIVSNEVKEYDVSGKSPEVVEMPINWTHNITNTGDSEMKLLLWISETYNPDDPDTYPENV